MSDRGAEQWLMRLCDPEGPGELPIERLTMPQFADVLALSDAHGVTGAVLSNVRRLLESAGRERLFCLSRSPTEAADFETMMAAAQQRWFALVAMTLCLRQRASQVMSALRSEGFPTALIKGEDFTDRLYGEPSLRPFRDIDLLMPRHTIDAAAPIMTGLGFRYVVPAGKYDQHYGERTWDSISEPRTRVELHWNMINCPSQRRLSSLAFEELQWEESTSERSRCRATPAAMLLIACVHAAVSHRFDRLQHLCDIRQICRGRAGRVDFDWLRDTARRTGNTAALTGALEVARRLLGDPACEAAQHALRLPIARTAWRCLVSNETLLHPQSRWAKLRRTALREWLKRAA